MCGIVGIVDYGDNVDKNLLKKMTSLIHHRGPDGGGYFINKYCGLAHRRLSIIDVSNNGRQPMCDYDEKLIIVYNGEVYNFKQIREELEEKGYSFKSNSDTEVIVNGYSEWGESIVQKMVGMFALAIWDMDKKELFCARDRAGQKPFFYYYDGNRFVFASELKSILLDDFEKEISNDSISHYLTMGYVPAPLSIFSKVKKLKPGFVLKITKDGIKEKQYWDVNFNDSGKSQDYYVKKICESLNESVKSQLISDVPIGAFLSGGIDSSAVVAFMAKNMDNPVNTFSIGFDDDSFDETKYARMIAEKYDTNHQEFTVTPNAISVLPKLIWQYSEPYADSSMIPTYYVSKMTKKHVTVALNGDAGDEVFGGYERYTADKVVDIYNKIPRFIQKPFENVIYKKPESTKVKDNFRTVKRVLDIKDMEPDDRFIFFQSYFSEKTRDENLKFSKPATSTNSIFRSYLKSEHDSIHRKLYLDFKTYLPDDLMVKVDIATMAVSLEGRSPFLDHRLIELAATMPSSYKIHGFNKKFILKKALKNHIPKPILTRRKMGLGVPVGNWIKNDMKSICEEMIFNKRMPLRKSFVQRKFDQHIKGSKNNAALLWNLMCLEMWHRVYIDGDMKCPKNMEELR